MPCGLSSVNGADRGVEATIIENNPSNVSSGFELFPEEAEAEIDYLQDDSTHGTWEITEAGRARLAQGK